MHQCGVLLKKNMINKDLLFGLIGPELEVDEPFFTIALAGHRLAHKFPSMYCRYDLLIQEYKKHKSKMEIQSAAVTGSS